MSILIVSDLHLTDAPLETYRWDVFDWIETARVEHRADTLFILGDVFDRKDRHPSSIVNRLTTTIAGLAAHLEIFILKGNHDYLKPDDPFLRFLDYLPNTHWINQPTLIDIRGLKTLWLPHSKMPVETWEPLLADRALISRLGAVGAGAETIQLVLAHQSVIGSQTSNMFELNAGLDLAWLEQRVRCPIISGDIHVPQQIRSLTYVGTPHPVSFGDTYQCRALRLDVTHNTFKMRSIPIPTIQRHALAVWGVEDLQKLADAGKIKAGDHAKIRILLKSVHFSQWPTLKAAVTDWCQRQRIELFDIKLEKVLFGEEPQPNRSATGFVPVHPRLTLDRYIKQELIDPQLAAVGRQFLDEVMNDHGTADR